MSRKNKENSTLSDRFYEKVFKIKLKGTQETQPPTSEFGRAIEQEYAIKYLESLNIEPTKANIALILKANPLKNCTFSAAWNNGRVAETLTIVAREKKAKLPSETKLQNADAEELKPQKKTSTLEAKLTEIHSGKEEAKVHDENKLGKDSSPKGKRFSVAKFSTVLDEQENVAKEEEPKFKLDFNIESIKNKYLYPFNQSKQKKTYQNLTDDPSTSYLPQIEKGASNDVLDAFKYYFPFSHVKVPSVVLKELQTTLKISHSDIVQELKKFVESFPFDIFPHQKLKPDSEATISTFQTPPDSRVSERVPVSVKERGATFLKDSDLDKCKSILTTDEVARIIGVVCHLSYWQIFGHLNPMQPDLLTKKQMILISMEQLNILRKKVKNAKLWSLFILPMVVLTLKMMTESLLRNQYTGFFEVEKPCAIALEKLYLLITNMFDPNMLYSRFAFFESEIQAVNKKFSEHIDETKLRSKRLYGTNPYIDLYFPRPESDFVRNIRHKKNIIEKKKDQPTKAREFEETATISNNDQENGEPSVNKEHIQQSYKVKMFQVLLDRIDDNGTADHRRKTGILNFDKEKI